MKKIDFHVHGFPASVAKKALPILAESAKTNPRTDGTLEDTIRVMKEWDTEEFVFLNIASTPRQQTKVNEFLIESKTDKIHPFGSVHPYTEDVFDAIKRIAKAGLKGVKFHPDYQGFDMDDPRVYPVYEACAAEGLILMFHAGKDPAYLERDRCHPKRAANILDALPGAKIVMAHMGGFLQQKEVLEYLCGRDVYFDTSVSVLFMTAEETKKLIRLHGVEKILYATDCPWTSGPDTCKKIEAIGLSEEERKLIYHGNAMRLLGI